MKRVYISNRHQGRGWVDRAMNEPKNIGAIVRDAYAKLPPTPIKDLVYNASESVPAGDACSWLGKFAHNGWAIQITPRLSDRQWESFGHRAGETWDGGAFAYDAMRSLELLRSLFPRHAFALKWPTCTKRQELPREGKPPLYVVCGAQAQHTETKLRDVSGCLVAIARCEQHRGQL